MPNHGKQVVTLGTVIATPPLIVVGIRGYVEDFNGKHARFAVGTNSLPRNAPVEVDAIFEIY